MPANDADWSTPQPAVGPEPSYVPAAMALGIMLGFWSIVTHWAMFVVGLGLFLWSLRRWMSEICRDWSRSDDR